MRHCRGVLFIILGAAIGSDGFAQKVKVGYDKSVDFSKYKTYTWAELASPPARPMLHATVVSWIDGDLNSKGIQRVDKDGDLILEATGGIGFGISVAGGQPLTSSYNGPPPSLNATMWTGTGQRELMPAVPDASLQLQFVDRKANEIIWSGSVSQALDMNRKDKSLELVDRAVTKLLKQFPPKRPN